MRKLTLRRQTVRALALSDVRKAAGGLFGTSACQKECSYAYSGCFDRSSPTDSDNWWCVELDTAY